MAEYIQRSYIRKMAMFEMAYTMETETDALVVLRMIDDAPAADVAPVVHWVLTDEKLPPEGQDVLCWYEYFRYGAFNRMCQTYGIGSQFNGNWGGEVANGRNAKVLAWMPLPEPPKMDGGADHDA